MEQWDEAHGRFGYEIASGLLVALVLQKTLSKKSATTLIRETMEHLIGTQPHLEEEIRQIAAKSTAQVQLLTLMEGRRD